MKAEERKHLEQNELLARLSKWWKDTRSGENKPSNTVWIITAGVALFALLIVGWRYYAGSAQKSRANLLAELDWATTAGQLEQIADTNKGTAIGRAAKAQLARAILSDGMSKLGSEAARPAAIMFLVKARSLYDDLAKAAADDADLLREAMLCRAKAEESLTAVPNPENKAEVLGNLDKAQELYDQLAAKYADTAEGKEAAGRARDIKEHKADIQKFYEELQKRLTRGVDPKLDPTTPAPTPGSSVPVGPQITPIIPKSTEPLVPVKPALTPVEPPKKKSAEDKPTDAKSVDPKAPTPATPAPATDAPKPADAKPPAPAPAPKPADSKSPTDASKPK